MKVIKTNTGKTTSEFIKDERVGEVFVFGLRKGIEEESIQRVFPMANIHFQCPGDEAISYFPYEPHRLVSETVCFKKRQMVVFVNPWETENLGHRAFDVTKLLFLINRMVNEWRQKIVLVSYEDDELKPVGTYYRELFKHYMVRSRIKSRFKELFGLISQSSIVGTVHTLVV